MNYEIGKWFWFEFEDLSPCISKLEESKNKKSLIFNEAYDVNGLLVSNSDYLTLRFCKGLATSAQIETCLKAYAEKNGYVGSKVILIRGVVGSISEEIKYLEMSDDDLWGENDCNSYTLYHNGKWAEIVQHAPSKQDKQLINNIQEYLTDQDLEKMNVLVNGYSVSLLKCVEVYRKCLEIKKVIG